MFKNESAEVETKARKAKEKAIVLRDERDFQLQNKKAIAKVQDAIGMPLLFPLIDQGITFFMMNYTIGLDQPPLHSKTYNQHLSTYGFHPIIATAMTALGLSGIGNIYNDSSYRDEAFRWYLKALNLTNKALTSTAEAKSDSTLLGTMLLSNFEATSNDESLEGFINHILGTTALLRMRGKQQFSTPAGRRMYMQSVGVLTMLQMGRGEHMPDFVHHLNGESEKYEDDSPGDLFYHLQIETIDFRADVIHDKMTDYYAIIDRALEIDARALKIVEGLGENWSYEDVPVSPGTPGVFGDTYHIYPHLEAAQTWNWIRYNRIYLHDIIRNTLLAGFATRPPIFTGKRYARLLQESTDTLYDMQAGIIASIPQHLYDTPRSFRDVSLPVLAAPNQHRYFWSNFSPNYVDDKPNPEVDERLPIVRISGGYSSMWALYLAGTTPIASPESQEFILSSFRRIKSEFGINQAQVLENVMRRKMRLDWTRPASSEIQLVPRYIPHPQYVEGVYEYT